MSITRGTSWLIVVLAVTAGSESLTQVTAATNSQASNRFRVCDCNSCETCLASHNVAGPSPSQEDKPDTDVPTPVEPMPDFEETGSAFLAPTMSIADSNVLYIDSAILADQVRVRFDAYYDFQTPDRAEFFYTTWTDFGGRTSAAIVGPNDSVDSQIVWLYFEKLLTCRLSAFVDAPFVFNNPSGTRGVAIPPTTSPGPNTSGFGDIIAGLKYELWSDCNEQLTVQLKNYIPTGDPDKWITAGHYSIEPGLLYLNRVSDLVTVEAEIRDWIPIGGADGLPMGNGQPYAGNVLRYGIGASYRWIDNCTWRVTPVVEMVGWSVLEGQKFEFDPDGPVDADGDTIVNLKGGLRIQPASSNGVFAVSYGHSLTDDRWYREVVRAEYRIAF